MNDLKINASEWFLTFFKDFIGTPAILVGLFAMLGSILLRKKFTDIIMSFFKTAAGFLIISGGAGVLIASLKNFQVLFEDLFGVSGTIPNNEALAGQFIKVFPEIAQLGSIIMVLGMILNILLSYTSRFKYIYLSGHVLFYMSIMLAGVMSVAQNTIGLDLKNPADYTIILISSGLILSIYMVLSAAATRKYVRQITKMDNITIGHTGNFGYALSGLIGELIYKLRKNKKIKSAEEINFPKWLKFFRNTFASMAISMLILFLIVYIPEGIMYNTGLKQLSTNLSTEQRQTLINLFGFNAKVNWLVQCIIDAFTFAAGVEIILYGVRMAVGELVPSFKGFSEKVVKNSIPALDCPIIFPYAPNAVLIGFISSLSAGLVGIGITIGLSKFNNLLPVVIPGLVAHFFLGATSGVFGNNKGGILGAIIGPFVHGLIITLVPIIFAATTWNLKQINLAWGDSDYLLGIIPGMIGYITNTNAIRSLLIVLPLSVYLALCFDGILKKIKHKKNTTKIKNLENTKNNKEN